jgi:hypothetical protein
MIKFVSATFALVMLLGSAAAGMDIVRDGQACTAIVVPDKAFPIVTFAAEELQHHVQKATGAKLEIVPEGKKPGNFAGLIYVGECQATAKAGLTGKKLPINAYRIKLIGPDFFFYGDDNDMPPFGRQTHIGTISAVYEFLEDKLGVRWLWPGELGEYVPQCKDITVDKWDQDYHRRFTSTSIATHEKQTSPEQGWSSPEVKGKWRGELSIWLHRQRFNLVECIQGTHSFTQYWDRFGKTRPEFFQMLPNGRRGPLEGDNYGINISMCVSDPGLHKQIVDDWKKPGANTYLESVYGEKYLWCCDDDTAGLCTCPRCRSWDAPDPRFQSNPYWSGKVSPGEEPRFFPEDGLDPSLSDRYAKFYLAVQKETRKVNPDVVVIGFAYCNYSAPPKETMLNDHILISYVPPYSYPITNEREALFRGQWDGWRKTGARLVFRPNITCIGHNFPISYTRRVYDMYSYAAQHGMIGSDFDALCSEWAIQGPSQYLLGRMTVRPELPLETILDEYYTAFGPAKDAVKQYFDYWEKISYNLTVETFMNYQKESGVGGWDLLFTPEVMKRGRALLELAKATPGLSEEEAARVEFLGKGLQNTELTLAAINAAKQFKKSNSPEDKKKLAIALKKLYSYRKRVDSSQVSNMGLLYLREMEMWDISLIQEPTGDNSEPLAEVWKFRFDPNDTGCKENWQAEGLDDSSWDDIRVNSCWEKQKPGKDWEAKHGGKNYDGIAWYRTRFTPHPRKANERVILYFLAVDESCVVYLNGKAVHQRDFDIVKNPQGWNEPFEVDVTDYLKAGGANCLAVRVGDRAYAGGVWKPVYLIYKDGS